MRSVQGLPPAQREKLEQILQSREPGFDGRCYCAYCICGLHKCPTRTVRCKYPSQLKSSYKQDFVGHPFDKATDEFNPNRFRRTPADHPMDGATTYKVRPARSSL